MLWNRNCKIGNNVLIGAGSRLNDTAKIENSTVGENCVLEGGSVIKNSYLWDNVHVGSGCIVKESILGAGVILETGAVIERGCLIEDGVLVRAHARVPEYSKVPKRAAGKSTLREHTADFRLSASVLTIYQESKRMNQPRKRSLRMKMKMTYLRVLRTSNT